MRWLKGALMMSCGGTIVHLRDILLLHNRITARNHAHVKQPVKGAGGEMTQITLLNSDKVSYCLIHLIRKNI